MGAFAERIAAGLSASRRMSQQSDHSSTAWPIGARYDFTESSSVGVGGGDFNPFTVSVGQFSQSRIQLMGSSGSAPFQFVIRKNVNAETGESADQFSFSVTAPWFGGGKLSSVATFGAGSVSFGYRGTSKPDAYGNASGWSWDAGGNGISSRLRTQTFMQNKSGIVAGAFADYEVNTLKAQAEWAAGAVVAGGALVIIANPETAPFIAGPIGAAATAR
jgi:hypothetical protein